MAGRLLVTVAVAACVAGLPAGCSRSRAPARTTSSSGSAGAPDEPVPASPPASKFPTAGDAASAKAAEVLRELQAVRVKQVQLVEGPWADARTGQYVTHRVPGGGSISQKVIRADKHTVTLEVTTVLGDVKATRQQRMSRMVEPGQGADSIPGTAEWAERTVRIGGREIPCRVATWRRMVRRRTRTMEVWLSDAVPGRIVRSGRVDKDGGLALMLELVEFGQ